MTRGVEIADADRSRRGWARHVRAPLILTLTAAALALLGWQIERADPLAVAARVAEASAAGLLLAGLLTGGRFAAFAVRLALITRRLVPCRVAPFFRIVMASQVISLLLPGLRVGAAWLRAHLASRRFGGGTALHLGPNVLDQLASAVAWVVAILLLSPWLVSAGATPSRGVVLGLAAGAGLAVGLAWLARRHGARLVSWLDTPRPGRRGELFRASSRTLSSAGRLVRDPWALGAGLVGGLAFLGFTGLAQQAALFAIGHPVPAWLAIMTVVLGGAAGTAAHTPGGLGVTEVAQVAFLVSQGVPDEAAASAVLVARAWHYGLVVVLGGPALIRDAIAGRLSRLEPGAVESAAPAEPGAPR